MTTLVDPRHQARRGRPRPDRRAGRGARTSGPTRSTGCSTLAPLPDPGVRQPALAGRRRRLAGVARAAARLRREGDARGRRPHRPGPTPTRRTRRAVHAAVDAAFDDAGGARASSTTLVARVAGPGWTTPCPPSCSRSRCRACPTSTRAASCGSSRWSTPTTGGRSTSTYAARCWPVLAGERRRRPSTTAAHAKLLVTQRALRLRRDQPRAVHDVRAGRRAGARPPTTCSPSTAAARSPSRPGCRSAWPARRLGRHGARRCPTAAGPTCSPAASTPATPPLADAARRLPGRAAGRGRTHDDAAADRSTSGRRAPQRRPAVGAATRRRRDDAAATTAGGSPPSRRPGPTDGRRRLRLPARRRPTTPRPDPRSRRQPAGVHERSRTFDPAAFAWTDDAWTGRQLAGLGDLRAARRHLHARGHARRRDRAGSTTCARSASTSSS